MKCFECNIEMKESKKPYHYEESGIPNLYLVNFLHYVCPKCKDQIIEIHNIEMLHLAIGIGLIHKPKILDKHEIIFLRKEIGLSAKEFAKELCVTNYSVSRWENGKVKPSPSNDKAIRLLFWKKMQKMIADRFDNIENTIQSHEIFKQEQRKINIDMPKLELIPPPHMIETCDNSLHHVCR